MHACGHDGHTAMLLGRRDTSPKTRNFAGDAVVIFQPAEEGGRCSRHDQGRTDGAFRHRSGLRQWHMAGHPVGSFAIRPGPIMAPPMPSISGSKGWAATRRVRTSASIRPGRRAIDHRAAIRRSRAGVDRWTPR